MAATAWVALAQPPALLKAVCATHPCKLEFVGSAPRQSAGAQVTL